MIYRKKGAKYLEAEKITHKDKLIERHMPIYIPHEKIPEIKLADIILDPNDLVKISEIKNINRTLTETELEITSRLIGFMFSNKNNKIIITKYLLCENCGRNCILNAQTIEDCNNLISDIISIGYESSIMNRNVYKNACNLLLDEYFVIYIDAMMKENGKFMPSLIINGTKRMKREFINGYLSGYQFLDDMNNNYGIERRIDEQRLTESEGIFSETV
jgi:hypothetical protein